MMLVLRLLALCLTLLASAASAVEVKPYAREDMASDAVRLTETLRAQAVTIGAQAKGKTPDDLRKAAAAAAAASKFDDAAKLAAAAVAAAPKDPANWIAYATVAIKADDAQANDRYELRRARRDCGLCRLSACGDARSAGRGAGATRGPACAPRAVASCSRRPEGLARPARLDRRAKSLRGNAGGARLPHRRLQGRQ